MDSAIEVMIWLFMGIVLIGLITAVVYYWDMDKSVTGLQEIFGGNEGYAGFKTDEAGFARAALEFLSNCSDTRESIYVQSTGTFPDDTMTKERIFTIYKELGWCKSIQSADNSCGSREDVVMGSIKLPAVVSLRCSNRTLFIG